MCCPPRLDKVEGILRRQTKGPMLEGDELTIGDLELSVTTLHMMASLGKGQPW